MLAVNSEIATSAEPWLMLPLWSMRDPAAGRAPYSHREAATAINDFIKTIPDGEHCFDEATREFALTLYGAAAQGRHYFLDKTPRYYLLIPYLQRLFPDAQFVFLVRHPLAMLASVADSFNNGHFRWFDYWIDWIEGHRCMAEAIRRDSGTSRVVRYEDLVLNPVPTVTSLCAWLGIPFTDSMVSSYAQTKLSGRMGDSKGIRAYSQVSEEPILKWRQFFGTSHRKAVAKRMLGKLRPEDLEVIGYPAAGLRQEISGLHSTGLLDVSGRLDSFINWLAYHADYRYLQARYRARRKREKYSDGRYGHT
jgi:sulfotransferase family protein